MSAKIIHTIRGTQEQLDRFKQAAVRTKMSLNKLSIHLLELCAKYPEIIEYEKGMNRGNTDYQTRG